MFAKDWLGRLYSKIHLVAADVAWTNVEAEFTPFDCWELFKGENHYLRLLTIIVGY